MDLSPVNLEDYYRITYANTECIHIQRYYLIVDVWLSFLFAIISIGRQLSRTMPCGRPLDFVENVAMNPHLIPVTHRIAMFCDVNQTTYSDSSRFPVRNTNGQVNLILFHSFLEMTVEVESVVQSLVGSGQPFLYLFLRFFFIRFIDSLRPGSTFTALHQCIDSIARVDSHSYPNDLLQFTHSLFSRTFFTENIENKTARQLNYSRRWMPCLVETYTFRLIRFRAFIISYFSVHCYVCSMTCNWQ